MKSWGCCLRVFLFFVGLMGQSSVVHAGRVGVYCYMDGDGLDVASDANVRLRLAVTPAGDALLQVENLTDRLVYVDRGLSFAYTNSLYRTLFVPSSQTESHSYTHGVVEKAGKDWAWIDGETHGQSQTVWDQRVAAVPPHATATVFVWEHLARLLRPDMVDTGSTGSWTFRHKALGHFLTPSTATAYPAGETGALGSKFRKNQVRHYASDATPLALRADVVYSFGDPRMGASAADSVGGRLQVGSFLRAMAVDSYRGVSRDGVYRPGFFPKAMAGRLPSFAFRSGRSVGEVLTEAVAVAAPVVVIVAAQAAMHHEGDRPDWAKNW